MTVSPTFDKITGAVMAIVSLCAITGTVRAMVLFGRMKFRYKKRFSHVSFLFVNLIATDFISGLFNTTFMSFNLLHSETSTNTTIFRTFCDINGISDVLSTQASVLLNAIISYGRYIAVCKSLRYNSIVTTKKIYTAVILSWVYSLYLAVLPYMWRVRYQYFTSISICSWYNGIFQVEGEQLQAFLFLSIISLPSLIPAAVVMICCSIIIYNLVAGQDLPSLGSMCCPMLFRRTVQKDQSRDLQYAKRMELIDAARFVLKIVLLFVLCNIAWWVKMVLDFLEFCAVVPLHWLKDLIGHDANHAFNRILKMLVLSNSAITPFLYSFTSFRKPSASQIAPPSVCPTRNMVVDNRQFPRKTSIDSNSVGYGRTNSVVPKPSFAL